MPDSPTIAFTSSVMSVTWRPPRVLKWRSLWKTFTVASLARAHGAVSRIGDAVLDGKRSPAARARERLVRQPRTVPGTEGRRAARSRRFRPAGRSALVAQTSAISARRFAPGRSVSDPVDAVVPAQLAKRRRVREPPA